MYDKIIKIRFKNYKSFSDASFANMDFTKPVSLIIGKNNSGKSSILDVIERVYCNRLAEFGNPVEEGCILQIGYHSRVIRINPDMEPSENTTNILWYQANKTEKSFLYNAMEDIDESWSPVGAERGDEQLAFYNEKKDAYEDVTTLLAGLEFARVNADRDITPEEAEDEFILDKNGKGTTNLIRHFINDSDLEEEIVEKKLLAALNKIMGEDGQFESIRVQQVTKVQRNEWEVFLKETGQNRYALSKTGSGLKTILLMLVNLFLVPALPDNIGKSFVFAFEELENNLHPALQRRVFNFLREYADVHKSNVRIFLTTHSHVAINIFSKSENTSIYHVYKDNGVSEIRKIGSYFDNVDILEDLDIKASDILQANGIIWVEGPSDRIYIKRWLELLTDGRFVEGLHYQFLYYGGKLLSHYELGGESIQNKNEAFTDGLVNILTTNRHAVIVIDSDKRKASDSINNTKQRIKDEFDNHGLMCWITEGKEIENYLTAKSINEAFRNKYKSDKLSKDIGKYKLFPNYIKPLLKGFSNVKVDFARRIASYITKNDFRYDLEKQIRDLANNIALWNKTGE